MTISDIAQGNHTPEILKTVSGKDKNKKTATKEVPISTARQDDPLYMAIVVGVLTALVILLAVAIFFIVHRHRHRKCFASPLAKSVASEKRPGSENYSRCGTSSHVSTLPVNKLNNDPVLDVKSDEYQEPYQALKYAPYFSYSTVLLEMKDFVKGSNPALSGKMYFFIICLRKYDQNIMKIHAVSSQGANNRIFFAFIT